MRPMSLYESGESSGEVSLEDMFETPDNIMGINKLSIDEIAFLICRVDGRVHHCKQEILRWIN